MTLPLATPITVRLPLDIDAQIRAAAGAAGKSIGVYIRDRLTSLVGIEEEMASIRHTVEQAVTFGQERESGPPDAMIEALILLRHMARPETLRQAFSELRRQGIEPWAGPAD
jgi:hypothetical protein